MPAILAILLLLTFALDARAELRLDLVRHSLTGSHCRYREYAGDVPSERYVTKPCADATLTRPPVIGRRFRMLDGRVAEREIVEEQPLRPFAVDRDAETGAVIRRVPLFFNAGLARVFDPNPVASLNAPGLQDQNDDAAAVPPAAYREVELQGAGATGPLRGPWVTLVDRQEPPVTPPDSGGPLFFDRQADGFEDVSAYFHIDRSQRHVQSLGYTGARAIAAYPIEVDAHAAGGGDNSFFIPSFTRGGFGSLYFGEGGTDDAEDADIVVHEYAHALLEWIAPGTFAGPFASQARAIAEGFGDYWAYSAHRQIRLASGRDPFCLADWDARCWLDAPSEQCAYRPGTDCLRRLDSLATMADYDAAEGSGVEHRNGAIWSSALREIHDRIGRTVADTIVLESLFGVPPEPTFDALATRMLLADRLLFGGANAEAICTAMVARGILPSCGSDPLAAATLIQSVERGLPIPENDADGVVSTIVVSDARPIEEVFVRVDIEHASRGDLRIELVAPDGTRVLLQQVSLEREADVHATFGLTAATAEPLEVLHGRSGAGSWQLVVRDLRTRDAGTLLSWGLLLRFAGDVAPVARPRAPRAQMIPVVTNVFGVGATRFRSDVRLANPGPLRQRVTLLFTRSGENGLEKFLTRSVEMEGEQVLALDDVVERAFGTAGSGTLEILGNVLVASRTYAVAEGGTVGQQVPAGLDSTAAGERELLASPFLEPGIRLNLGVTEVSGGRGVVRAGGRELVLEPFSHVQFPVGTEPVHRIEVVEGSARVVAYLSQIDGATADPMLIPAALPHEEPRTLVAPVISAPGLYGSEWLSDLWASSQEGERVVQVEAIGGGGGTLHSELLFGEHLLLRDVLARLFHRSLTLAALRLNLPPDSLAMTRIRNGGMSQFVPFLPPAGPPIQHILFVESSAGYRTNLGILCESECVAGVEVRDAAGAVVLQADLATGGGVARMAVPVMLTNGRAVVRFARGAGQAWGSLVDNRSGDATYLQGQ